MKPNYLVLILILVLLSASCAGPAPIAASCPPFPMPPAVVMENPRIGLQSPSISENLIEEWKQHWMLLRQDLRNAFVESLPSSVDLKRVPSGQ